MAPLPPLVLVRHGRPARHALWQAVGEVQGGDPLAPVTVAVPSPYAGLSLRRELGARSGLLNVRFLALARVAELLGAPYLAEPERRPLTPALALGAVRAALADDPGALGPVAGHAATVRSVAATFADLRELDDAALERLEHGGGRAPTIVGLYRRFRALTRDAYDDEDQLRAAAAVVDAGGRGLADVGTVVLFLPRASTLGATMFVAALARAGRARAIIGLTGDHAVDADAHALAARLAPALGPPATLDGGGDASNGDVVVSCPDADEEARAVVREVLTRLDAGLPLHRVAIAYRAAEPYARLLAEHFDAAGVPVHGPSPRRLADTAAGRLLLGLLALPDTGFRRDAVMELLAAAPVLEHPGGRRVPGPRWDRLSCLANVVTGLEQWRQRLDRYAQHHRERLERRARDAGALFAPDGPDRVLDNCTRLAAFVAGLATALEPPATATWASLSAWTLGLLDRYLGRTLPGSAPAAEQAAADRVRAVVESLAGLDDLAAPASIAALRDLLEEALDTSVGHVGAFGDGVLVAPLGALAGTDYEALFVVGMTEGMFPPPPRDDPLLPDVERDRVDGSLPRRGERRAGERAGYLAALATAPWRWLSFARADTRSARAARPAAWLLESAAAHAGHLVAAHELDPGTPAAAAAIASGWLRIVASFDRSVRDTLEPASTQEYDVQSLLHFRRSCLHHPLVRRAPRLAAGLRAVRARAGRRVDTWDGVVPSHLITPPGEEHALSPTALESWTACPFRYLLQQVLHVHAVESPEERDRLTGRDRGTLVHRVLERFFRAHPRPDPDTKWTRDERAALQKIAEEECDAFEHDGLTGRPVLWHLDRARLLRELDRVLDTDEVVRAERRLVPESFELGFGGTGDELSALRLALPGGAAVAFRGRIDRLDRSADGHLEVFDYKTGAVDVSLDDLAADPVGGGTRLQLPLYAMAVRDDAAAPPVHTSYWYTREVGAEALRGFALDGPNETRVREVLDLVAEEITAGHFAPYPGADDYWSGPLNCRHCDYQQLCPRDRVRRFERRRDDPAYDGILALREPEPADADELEPEGAS